MSTFEQITRRITKFAYDEVPQLFEYLKINAADWPYEEAQSEFDALLEKMLRLNQKHNTPSFTVVCGIPCSGKTRVSDALYSCLLYTSPSPRDKRQSRMPSSA